MHKVILVPQTSVTTTGVSVVGANAQRKSILFRNGSTAGTIFLDNTLPNAVTTTTAGIRLNAGDAISIQAAFDGIDQLRSEWSAIADSGTVTLVWKEFFGEEQKVI